MRSDHGGQVKLQSNSNSVRGERLCATTGFAAPRGVVKNWSVRTGGSSERSGKNLADQRETSSWDPTSLSAQVRREEGASKAMGRKALHLVRTTGHRGRHCPHFNAGTAA